MKKALDYLYAMKNANEQMGQEPISINEAIEELEDLESDLKGLKNILRDFGIYNIKVEL